MHKYFLNATVNYLHLLLMPLFTCFGIKNEPVNLCVLWKMYKCYLILLLDVMLINVKSQINSILNRWIWYHELWIQGRLLSLNYFVECFFVCFVLSCFVFTAVRFWVGLLLLNNWCPGKFISKLVENSLYKNPSCLSSY